MAIDKGYGSGKPRSAANSRARQRVAAKRYSKGKKNPEFNLVSKAGEVADYIVSGPKETRGKYLEVGVSPTKLVTAAKLLLQGGNVARASDAAARAAIKQSGRRTSKVIAQFGGARKISNGSFPTSDAANTLRNARTTIRGGTEAYPRSFDAFVGRSPRSTVATQKTPSAQNFYQGGKRYVDTRYTFDPITNPRVRQYTPKDGYKTQPKKITGPKTGAALNPTGTRYAPPRKSNRGR